MSPNEADGLLASIRKEVQLVLDEQRQHFLGQFSLDNPQSALSRLINQVGGLQNGLKNEFDVKVGELTAQLSLDIPDSALSRMSRTFETAVEDMVRKNALFHGDVRESLATLKAQRQEEARSTRHGGRFEDEMCSVLAIEAQRSGDIYEATGSSTGIIKNCKVGDCVVTLGPDSVAPDVRIVWEAKEDRSYSLKNALEELDQARKNRSAQIGVFVFSKKTAPVGLDSLARYGSDLAVVWDSEDSTMDLFLKTAHSISRFLAIRTSQSSAGQGEALSHIEVAVRDIEKQVQFLDEMKTHGQTIKSNSEKILDRIEKMRKALTGGVTKIDQALGSLRLK